MTLGRANPACSAAVPVLWAGCVTIGNGPPRLILGARVRAGGLSRTAGVHARGRGVTRRLGVALAGLVHYFGTAATPNLSQP